MSAPVINSVEEVSNGMGPDHAIVRLHNGIVLFIGYDGINEFESEAAMQEGEPCGGMMFSKKKFLLPTGEGEIMRHLPSFHLRKLLHCLHS